MGTRAIIAVTLADGSLLASNVALDGGHRLAGTLAEVYTDHVAALELVMRGDLLTMDLDGAFSMSTTGAKPQLYADLDALDDGKLGDAHHIHLFRDGAWEHLLDDEGQFQEELEMLELLEDR